MANEKKNAFVVWLDPGSGATGEAERYRGRVEHVPTSTREPFSTKDELLAFIERYFDAVGEGDAGDGSDGPLV